MLKYTICFIKRAEEILMLNRIKAPQMGVWNGVGGKIEAGETPEESALREIYEETGIQLDTIQRKGMITWNGGGGDGMYAFIASVPSTFTLHTPVKTDEGILDWKPLDWLTNKANRGVAEHIQRSLPVLLNDPIEYEHCCYFNAEGHISEFSMIPLQINSTSEKHCVKN